MRDHETIDSELRLIALGRQSIREQGGQPSCRRADELLDERLGHRVAASETGAVAARETGTVAVAVAPRARKGVLRRFGPLAALPLSALALATVLMVLFADRSQRSAAQPSADPPPTSARSAPAAPKAQAPPLGLVDGAFIDVLKQQGVPVPSQDYVLRHGHAVCDFLAHQPNMAEAVRFVQGSSVWDADQSAEFAAGAIVSYCPQYYGAASPNEVQQPDFQKALSDLQAIDGDLQGIEGGLQGIRGDLQDIPGHR